MTGGRTRARIGGISNASPMKSVRKPGGQEQRRSEEDHRSIGELVGGYSQFAEAVTDTADDAQPFALDKPRAEQADADHQNDGGDPIDLARDLGDQVDLDHREEEEGEEKLHTNTIRLGGRVIPVLELIHRLSGT